jgi:predicted amidohydrolase
MIPTRAYENGVYLAYANSAGTQNGMAFLGSSVIAGPDGQECVRAGDEVQIIHAKVDKKRISDARASLPYLAGAIRLSL